MILVYAYLAIGVLAALSMLAFAYFSKAHALHWRRPEDVTVIVFLIAGVPIVWPALVVFLAWEIVSSMLRRGHGTAEAAKEEKFRIVEKHLIEALSVAEIERRELVDDPLGGAPRVPFGHLNVVWAGLLEGVTPEGSIWSFSAEWKRSWGGVTLFDGYVVKTGGVIGPHILTGRR